MLILVHRATLPAALGSTSCTPPTSPERGVLSAVIGQDIQHQHTPGLSNPQPQFPHLLKAGIELDTDV